MREIILDTETTGLDPKRGDRLIELACVEMVNRIPSGKVFHELIDPEREVPKEAEAIHGLSTEMVRGKPLFKDLVVRFQAFIGDAPLIIHNAAFDIGFLNHELKKACFGPISMDRVVDTLAIARRKHPGSPSSLDALCKRYKIDNSKRVKHSALLDCELLADVYVELMGGNQTVLGLGAEVVTTAPVSGTSRRPVAVSQRPTPLAPRLSEMEQAAHTAFIATLKNPLWLKTSGS
jgi:DNA polymerase III subunit epsilon